jgi:hypothetical protein
MNDKVSELIDQIAHLEGDLARALSERATQLSHGIRDRRVQFEAEILRRHQDLRQGLFAYLKAANPLSVITAPIIYSLIIPIALLDIFLAAYQIVCFRVYGIPKVQRSDYLIFDRAYLAYLNPIEKFNCAYCSYANGVIAYAREVAGRTEAYWCPIKHARSYLGTHPYYKDFSDYGDAEEYQRNLEASRSRKNAN